MSSILYSFPGNDEERPHQKRRRLADIDQEARRQAEITIDKVKQRLLIFKQESIDVALQIVSPLGGTGFIDHQRRRDPEEPHAMRRLAHELHLELKESRDGKDCMYTFLEQHRNGHVKVAISGVSGDILCSAIVTRSWSVCDLKRHVQKEVAIPMEEQTLVFGAEELRDFTLVDSFAKADASGNECGVSLTLVRSKARVHVCKTEKYQSFDEMIDDRRASASLALQVCMESGFPYWDRDLSYGLVMFAVAKGSVRFELWLNDECEESEYLDEDDTHAFGALIRIMDGKPEVVCRHDGQFEACVINKGKVPAEFRIGPLEIISDIEAAFYEVCG